MMRGRRWCWEKRTFDNGQLTMVNGGIEKCWVSEGWCCISHPEHHSKVRLISRGSLLHQSSRTSLMFIRGVQVGESSHPELR
jgi:hypothetical protein